VPGTGKLRWSVESRLQFIEFRLYWDGKVNRPDLVDFFGISVPQASSDIKLYLDNAPNNAEYDRRAKAYLATPSFRPVLSAPNAQQYLAPLRSIAEGVLSLDQTWLGTIPPLSVMPAITRQVNPEKLRTILDAIRTRSSIHVQYQSLSRETPTWRWLSPHALAFDGLRWHLRAWCSTRKNFQDFVFARIITISEVAPADDNQVADIEWLHPVTLRISPHPDLSEAAQRAIEIDYGMANGTLEIETSVSMSFYLERRLNLDLDPSCIRPERQQIILANRDEVDSARKYARDKRIQLQEQEL